MKYGYNNTARYLTVANLFTSHAKAQAKLTNTCINCGSCTYYCRVGKNVMEIIESVNQ